MQRGAEAGQSVQACCARWQAAAFLLNLHAHRHHCWSPTRVCTDGSTPAAPPLPPGVQQEQQQQQLAYTSKEKAALKVVQKLRMEEFYQDVDLDERMMEMKKKHEASTGRMIELLVSCCWCWDAAGGELLVVMSCL